jgi:hypothetical protein
MRNFFIKNEIQIVLTVIGLILVVLLITLDSVGLLNFV